jgi:hypothetical protein
MLMLSTFEAYDDTRLGALPSADPATPDDNSVYQGAGAYSGALIGASYGRTGERSSLTASGRSGVAYYPLTNRAYTSLSTKVAASKRVGRHTVVNVTPSFSYAPYFNFGLFPGLGDTADIPIIAAPDLDLAIAAAPVYRYSMSGGIEQTLTDRSSLNVSYSAQRTDVRDLPLGLTMQRASGRFTHSTSRSLGFHVGYAFVDGQYQASARPIRAHDVDAGLDLHRALSLSRHTTFSFSTGSTILTRGADLSSAVSPSRVQFGLLGHADLLHQIGRTGSLQLSYRRDWRLADGFADPVFVDGVTLGMGGTFNRRATAGIQASYLSGHIAFNPTSQRQESYTGTAWFRVAMTRTLSFYTQYRYYHQNFTTTALPLDVAPELDRHSVRVGLSLMAPLTGHAR